MALRQYVASGKAEPNAVIFGVVGTVVVGLLAGVAEGLISQWFSLFILFPILLGLAVGAMGTVVVKKQKLRAPLIALLVGLLGGTVAYAATHGVSYLAFRRAVAQAIRDNNPTASDDEVKAALEQAIVEASGRPGVAGFMLLAAKQGVTISKHGSKTSFTGTGAWIVWALEWLCAALAAALMMRSTAKEPFCEGCEDWYGAEQALATVGDGKKKEAKKAFLAAVEVGDFPGAAQALAGEVNTKNHFTLTSRACGKCSLESFLTLKHVATAGNKTNVVTVASWLMSPDEVGRLLKALSPQVAVEQPGQVG